MYPFVLALAFLAIGLTAGSVLALLGILFYLPEAIGRVRIIAVVGWSSSSVGWAILAAYLLAPIWFRVLVR